MGGLDSVQLGSILKALQRTKLWIEECGFYFVAGTPIRCSESCTKRHTEGNAFRWHSSLHESVARIQSVSLSNHAPDLGLIVYLPRSHDVTIGSPSPSSPTAGRVPVSLSIL